jgi:hypothetical protein
MEETKAPVVQQGSFVKGDFISAIVKILGLGGLKAGKSSL